MNKKDVYSQGYQTGYDIAWENAADSEARYFETLRREGPPMARWADERRNVMDQIVSDALETESEHYRQFSPFEFFAADINRSRHADSLWAAYEDGVHKGALAAAKEHVKTLKKVDLPLGGRFVTRR
jgi:hypothetical protein